MARYCLSLQKRAHCNPCCRTRAGPCGCSLAGSRPTFLVQATARSPYSSAEGRVARWVGWWRHSRMTDHTPMPKISRLEVIATGSRRRWTPRRNIELSRRARSRRGLYQRPRGGTDYRPANCLPGGGARRQAGRGRYGGVRAGRRGIRAT
jgi:hypothetical protein